MNEATLLEYGLRDVLRAADARRNAAGLTRSQAERACVLAAKAERSGG